VINQNEKSEELKDSFTSTLKQFLTDIPKILKGIYFISVGLGGLLLFFYFTSINYVPIFDLSSALWIPVFIAGIGLMVVVLLGFVFALPGWMLNIFIDDIREPDKKERLLKFLNFEDHLSKQKRLAFCFFAMPWLINFLFLAIVIYAPKYFFSAIKWVDDISYCFLFVPLILIPFLWKKYILPKELNFSFKKLFVLSLIFWVWFFLIIFLSIPLSFAQKNPINKEWFAIVYLLLIYVLCGFATWAIGCAKDKRKFLKIVLVIITIFPLMSLLIADKVDLMVNTPIQIFNLGRSPIKLKLNMQYAENINHLLSSKKVVIRDGIIGGSLLTRLGAEYVIEMSCKECHKNGRNIILPIPKEKVESIILMGRW